MTIPRHARDLHAGDVITADPDHKNRPVRWRVADRPKIDGYGVALIDYADLDDGAARGVAWFDGGRDLPVEPAPYAVGA